MRRGSCFAAPNGLQSIGHQVVKFADLSSSKDHHAAGSSSSYGEPRLHTDNGLPTRTSDGDIGERTPGRHHRQKSPRPRGQQDEDESDDLDREHVSLVQQDEPPDDGCQGDKSRDSAETFLFPLRRWSRADSGDDNNLGSDAGNKKKKKPQETANMNRLKGKKSVLSALMPGAEIKSPKRPILVNAGLSRETVTFNIGGTMFETSMTTLNKLPHSPLADETFLRRHYRPDKKHYFFDRDPDVFGAVLNYLRTGELHLPTKFCGPQVKTEMEYWGIEEDEIEECCWTTYSAWTSTLDALKKLEKDRKSHMPASVEHPFTHEAASTASSTTSSFAARFRKIQIRGWDLMNNPRSSIFAQIYSYVSLCFVLASIFSFVAQTHEFFRVPINEGLQSTNNTINISSSSSNGSLNSSASATSDPVTSTTGFPPVSTASAAKAKGLDDAHPSMLFIDAACLAFFVTEFFVRVILSPQRLRMFLLPMTIFDVLALLPDVIEFGMRIVNPDMRLTTAVDVITFLRLLRVFRIFRLMRHFPGLWILFYTLKASIQELLLLLLFVGVGTLFFASLIYYSDDRTVFTSIPHACYWAVITMTTVGYGDMFPTTELGYVIGTMTALCGVLVIGFTVPVLVNNFILYYQHTQCAISREGARQKRLRVQQWRRKDRKRRARFLVAPLKVGCGGSSGGGEGGGGDVSGGGEDPSSFLPPASSYALTPTDVDPEGSMFETRSRALSNISETSLIHDYGVSAVMTSLSDDDAIDSPLPPSSADDVSPPARLLQADSNGNTLDLGGESWLMARTHDSDHGKTTYGGDIVRVNFRARRSSTEPIELENQQAKGVCVPVINYDLHQDHISYQITTA